MTNLAQELFNALLIYVQRTDPNATVVVNYTEEVHLRWDGRSEHQVDIVYAVPDYLGNEQMFEITYFGSFFDLVQELIND